MEADFLPNIVVATGISNARAAAAKNVASSPLLIYISAIRGGPIVCPILNIVALRDIIAARYSSGARLAIDV